MVGRSGGGGLKFGAIEIYSQTESLEDMRQQLEKIIMTIGYPSWVDRADEREEDVEKDSVDNADDVSDESAEIEQGMREDDMQEVVEEQKKEQKKFAPWLVSRAKKIG